MQLPRSNKQCPHCRETEAVFFQSQQRSAETGMVSLFRCLQVRLRNQANNGGMVETFLCLLQLWYDLSIGFLDLSSFVLHGAKGRLASLHDTLTRSYRSVYHENANGFVFCFEKILLRTIVHTMQRYPDTLHALIAHICIGASDKIFDHCLSLSSDPTIPA